MFNINDSAFEPQKLIELDNGDYIYNFDIKPYNKVKTVIEDFEKKEITKVRYKYHSVTIKGGFNVANTYDALLKAYYVDDDKTLYDALNSPSKTSEMESIASDLYDQAQILLGVIAEPTELETAKKKMIKRINEYDVSPDVNSFYLNGLQVWLDKSTRVGLMNSLNIEKSSGKTSSTLWFGNIKLEINIDTATQMLSSLEIYALQCYNKTAEHKMNVNNLFSVSEVNQYDYTKGYPEKLTFNV